MLTKLAANEVIVETDSDIMRFVQPSHMTPSKYAEELVTKTLWSRDVHEEKA